MPLTRQQYDDPDDVFAETRMSFGDHLEELRTRLWKAIKALVFCLFIGFFLDGVGYFADWPDFGIGRPVFNIMTSTVEEQVRNYYNKRNEEIKATLANINQLSPEEWERINEILKRNDNDISSLSAEDRLKALGKTEAMPMIVPVESLTKFFGPPKDPNLKEVTLQVQVYPAYMNYLNGRGEALLRKKNYIASLSVQEPALVYIKVSLLCGVVLGSPYIFYQLWAFVAAGLYRHEKKYVHVFLPFSLGLFLAGVFLCQFLVLPNAVKALLGINHYLGVDPDIRLDEWLSFALILPLVFGLSFQTPLVMLFLNRIGLFTYQDYVAYWRAAIFSMVVVSVVLLPTPDALTLLYLIVPMAGLYGLGIAICWYFPPAHEQYVNDEADQVAV